MIEKRGEPGMLDRIAVARPASRSRRTVPAASG